MRAPARLGLRCLLGAILSGAFFSGAGLQSESVLADGNRLAYLDGSDPYYVSESFPKLSTPQWIAEDGVDAVIVLSIDDLRSVERYEEYLRPILERLKRIDGRAPVSIMTCTLDPKHPHLQSWLAEGLSLETHTIDHPCPLLAAGDFEAAKSTFDRCVDQMARIQGNRPIAFRVPCMDSLNTPSPRFYAEVFNGVTAAGNFLTIDSSICNLPTPDDAELPLELLLDADGTERFRKYVPFSSYANVIRNYPYPWVIGRLCWQFPCVVPSDWQAQHVRGKNHPQTVEDLKLALDVCVAKKGVYNLIFHPHGWIRAEQIVELIDHAVERYGPRVRFLSFAEAAERLSENLLAGETLRTSRGDDNGVRLLDIDGDGFIDVLLGNERQLTRRWNSQAGRFDESPLPFRLVHERADGSRHDAGLRFGVIDGHGRATAVVLSDEQRGAWTFDGERWVERQALLTELSSVGKPRESRTEIRSTRDGVDQGLRLRDIDRDGIAELLVASPEQQSVFRLDAGSGRFLRSKLGFPPTTSIVDGKGRDAGLRFVDVDGDLYDDILFSNEERYGLWLWSGGGGWTEEVFSVRREADAQPVDSVPDVPPIVRQGRQNGAWMRKRTLWVQNEGTADLPDHVAQLPFTELLAGRDPRPLSPEASRRAFETRPGFDIELVAAEPLVLDPVAFDHDLEGRLWVVEMADYPIGLDGKGKPGGRVVTLSDEDGDGRYDKRIVFLDELPFPTGVRPWGRGALVTAAPDLLYAVDQDGDGRADERRVLYSGFGQGNQQHRVNSLVWGLDNWLYGANGDSGGKIRSTATGAAVNIAGRDFRFRPDDGEFEAVTGTTQFSRARDDQGNWFGCDNPRPIYHFVLSDRAIRRNEHSAAPPLRNFIGGLGGRVWPLSRTLPRYNDQHMANRFTSCCGLVIYRDRVFGADFTGDAFVSEPVHNLVSRLQLEADGVTFRVRRAPGEETAEFLRSYDNWFRPTTLRVAPDGSLWVADMYRRVIEHPQYFYEGNFQILRPREGDDRGRIWRVFRRGGDEPARHADLGSEGRDSEGSRPRNLVEHLESPNGWWRDIAHQELVRRRDEPALRSLEPSLRRKLSASTFELARLHALCALDGMGLLQGNDLHQKIGEGNAGALHDTSAAVRRHAARLTANFPDLHPDWSPMLRQLVDDPDPQVRLEWAYALGEWRTAAAGRALGLLALRSAGDPYSLAAVSSSVPPHLESVLAAVVESLGGLESSSLEAPSAESVADEASRVGVLRVLESLLPLVARLERPEAFARSLDVVLTAKGPGARDAWRVEGLAALLRALPEGESVLRALIRERRTAIDAMHAAAREEIERTATLSELRLASVRLLGSLATEQPDTSGVTDVERLAGLLGSSEPRDLQLVAVDNLERFRQASVPMHVLERWKECGPEVRGRVLDLLTRRDTWLRAMLEGLESGSSILPRELDADRRRRFLEHEDAGVRQRAESLLVVSDPDRSALIERTLRALSQPLEEPASGSEVFGRVCATCHRLGDVGRAVGPDLRALVDKSDRALLIGILDPNRNVEARYAQYAAVTRDGRVLTGIIAEETGNSVTLLESSGRSTTLLRQDLLELESQGASLMPEGLEKDITVGQMAALLEFLRQ